MDTPITKAKLTIFIDGQCPLCVFEMRHLKRKDRLDALSIIDIHSIDIASTHPDLDTNLAMQILHGKTDCGEWITGLDVTHMAWTLVGSGWRTAFLRWKILRPITDRAYLFFAKHRGSISKLLTGKSTIDSCEQCTLGSLHKNSRKS